MRELRGGCHAHAHGLLEPSNRPAAKEHGVQFGLRADRALQVLGTAVGHLVQRHCLMVCKCVKLLVCARNNTIPELEHTITAAIEGDDGRTDRGQLVTPGCWRRCSRPSGRRRDRCNGRLHRIGEEVFVFKNRPPSHAQAAQKGRVVHALQREVRLARVQRVVHLGLGRGLDVGARRAEHVRRARQAEAGEQLAGGALAQLALGVEAAHASLLRVTKQLFLHETSDNGDHGVHIVVTLGAEDVVDALKRKVGAGNRGAHVEQ